MNIIIEASDTEGLTWRDIRAAVEIGADHDDLDYLDLQYDASGDTITGIRVTGVSFPDPKPKPAMRGSYGPVEGDWRTTPQEPEESLDDVPEIPRDPKPVSVVSF